MAKKKHTHSTGTPATTLLDREAVPYTVHSYTHDPAAPSYGLEAAEALGVDPAVVFKTLLVATGEPGAGALAVGIVPVHRSLDLKAMAAALGLKKVEMADPAAAEPVGPEPVRGDELVEGPAADQGGVDFGVAPPKV